MRTIDTLARHQAALFEARRLTALVLANNSAFRALFALDVLDAETQAPVRDALEADLARDPVYLAWVQLGIGLSAAASIPCYGPLAMVPLELEEPASPHSSIPHAVTVPQPTPAANDGCQTTGAAQPQSSRRPRDANPIEDAISHCNPGEASVAIVRRECAASPIMRTSLQAPAVQSHIASPKRDCLRF